MDIAATSMQMSAAQVQAQVSTAVLGKVMDSGNSIAGQLIQDLASLEVGPSNLKVNMDI